MMTTDIFIAYEFPDPWASRMIEVGQDFERLVQRLADRKVLVTPYGPVIYRCRPGLDPQQHGVPLAAYCGEGVVNPVTEHGKTSGLMMSASDFVLEFLDE